MTQLDIRKTHGNYQHICGSCSSVDVLIPQCTATDGSWIRPLFQEPVRGIKLLLFWKVDAVLSKHNKLWIPRRSYPFVHQEERGGTKKIFRKMVKLLESCCCTVDIDSRVIFDIVRFKKMSVLSFSGTRKSGISREKGQLIIDEVLNLAEQYFYLIHTCRDGCSEHYGSHWKRHDHRLRP